MDGKKRNNPFVCVCVCVAVAVAVCVCVFVFVCVRTSFLTKPLKKIIPIDFASIFWEVHGFLSSNRFRRWA